MTTEQQRPMLHPHHDRIHQAVHNWFHDPMDAMGRRAIIRETGTFWDHGDVHLSQPTVEELPALLAEVRSVYCRCMDPRIIIDNAEQVCTVGSALIQRGWQRGPDTVFLAHVGVFPGGSLINGLTIAPVNADNLVDFAETRLIVCSDTNERPTYEQLAGEIAQHRAEMIGSGHGLLALINGEVAGLLWSYEGPNDVWISLLGVRKPMWRREIAQALLKSCVATAYSRGFRSVVINVNVDHAQALQLYQKLGFQDEVYRQWCYRESTG